VIFVSYSVSYAFLDLKLCALPSLKSLRLKEITLAFEFSALPALHYLCLSRCSFSSSDGIVQIGGNIRFVVFDTVVGLHEILHINVPLFELSLFFVKFQKIVISRPVSLLRKKYDISRPPLIENEHLVRFVCE
jgi:hypothetical protein